MVSTVEFLGEVDGGANGFLGFAGKSEDEVAVDEQAELLAVLGELARAFDGGALLHVLQDLRIAGLVADDEQAASGFLHRLQRFVVGGDARGARPGHLQRLQLLAKLDGARLLNVEGVVVEEEFLHPGPVFHGLLHFGGNGVGRALAPRVSAERLRPQAEGALRRTAARGVERDERIEQERHVVAARIDVALVNVDHIGQRVEVGHRRTVGIVNHRAIGTAIGGAQNFAERLAVGVLDGRVVELAAHDEVDGLAVGERLLGKRGDVRADEADLQLRDWPPSSRRPA